MSPARSVVPDLLSRSFVRSIRKASLSCPRHPLPCTSPSPSTAPAGTRPPGASPTPGRASCSPPATGPTWSPRPSAACSTSSPSRTALGLQSAHPLEPDDRTDRVRGPPRRRADRRPRRPAHPAHRPRADGGRHPHRAVPRVQGDRDPRLREHRPGRRAGPGRRPPERGRRTSGAARSRTSTVDDPYARESVDTASTRPPTTSRWCAGSGTAGRTTRRSATSATGRFVDRDKLHYIDFEGPHFSRQGPVDHPATAAGPAGRRRARPRRRRRTGWSPARADVGFVTPHDAAEAPRHRRRRSAAEQAAAGRAGEPLHVFGDLVVFLDDDPPRPRARRERLDELAGTSTPATPRLRRHARQSWPTCSQEWQPAGLTRLPAAAGRRCRTTCPQITRRAGAGTAAPGRRSARRTRPTPCAGCSGLRPPRQPLRRHRRCQRLSRKDRTTMSKPLKQIHLAAHFPGVNNTTVWSDPAAGSHIEFSSFVHFAADRRARQVRLPVPRRGAAAARAERPDLRPRRRRAGPTRSPCWPRWPPSPSASGWPARSTPRSTSRTRWPASSPRSTTSPTGAPRGTSSPRGTRSPARTSAAAASSRRDERYARAKELPRDRGRALRLLARRRDRRRQGRPAPSCGDAKAGAFAHQGRALRHRGPVQRAAQPAGPPGDLPGRRLRRGPRVRRRRPPTRSSPGTAPSRTGQAFYADVKGRLAKYGRRRDQLLILPAATFVLGDTDAEAAELAHEVRRRQVSGSTAIKFLEQLWNRDLSDLRPGRSAARRSTRRRREHHRPGPGQRADVPRPARHRQRVAASARRPRTCPSAS